MKRRTKIILASVLGGLGVLGILATIVSAHSPRDYITKHYSRLPDDRGAAVFASPRSPTQTAREIAAAVKPADRRATESGIFLRYRKEFVAVLAAPSGGSRIEVTDERSGYSHFYGYIGGYWGTYSGPAEHFRGGGPGVGK